MIKALIVLSVVLMVSANGLWEQSYGNDNSKSSNYDDYSQPIPYSFGYDVKDEHGLQLGRKETGDGHGSVKGSYSYRDGHGIERQVEYIADKGGFRARVKTNEPGTADSNPADVEMDAHPIIVQERSYKSDNNKGGW